MSENRESTSGQPTQPWTQARQTLERLISTPNTETLEQYILRLSPHYVPPKHLAPLLVEIERINRGEEVLLVCSSPPRGGKTETLLHSLPWLLERHSDW